jgi:uncharacterized protein (UPF0264 family)
MTQHRQTTAHHPGRTRLLISVVSAQEALLAQESGADIIDIKDPARGPLGMPDPQVAIQTVGALMAGYERPAPTSMALGELIDKPNLTQAPRGVLFAKAALAGADENWPALFRETFAPRPDITPVLALYAPMDQAEADRLGPAHSDMTRTLTLAQAAGARGVLFDTFTKDGRSLLDTLCWPLLPTLLDHARALGLWTALAGSLRTGHLPEVIQLRPDIIGMRGAACANHDRNAGIDAGKIREIKQAMDKALR